MRIMHIDRETTLRIAGRAECDPRSVARYCDGRPVRGVTAGRIARAMAELGYPLPRRPEAAQQASKRHRQRRRAAAHHPDAR